MDYTFYKSEFERKLPTWKEIFKTLAIIIGTSSITVILFVLIVSIGFLFGI